MLKTRAAPQPPNEAPMQQVDAIVIGASAGAVEAVSLVLAALPSGYTPAVLVVIHVPAANENLLVQVLAPRCALSVQEADDKEPIRGGTVYLAPPGYHIYRPSKTPGSNGDGP